MEDYKKKYEEKLSKAKALHNLASETSHDDIRMVLEELFDELKESEDERVRKALIHYFSEQDGILTAINGSVSVGDILAWLEKQGEQKTEIKDDVLSRFAFYQYDDDTIYLSSVFVEECNRKHGYGTKILKAAEGVAKTFGVSKIRLKVERNTWMEKWYKKNGYEYLSSEGEYDWLEKRVEQKSTDKVEPKFKIGDWVVREYSNVNIVKVNQVINVEQINDECFGYTLDDKIYFSGSWENYYHLWTIQDAKDGNVLACPSGWTCIFKSLNEDTFSSYCFIDKTGWFCEKGSECHTLNKEFTKAYNGEIKPATKEQRDLLFQKMKEAGYEWDAEKKELKKVESKPACKLNNSRDHIKFPFKARVKSTGKIVTIHGGQLSMNCNEWIKYQSDIEDGYKIYEPDNLELVCEIEPNTTWSKEDERIFIGLNSIVEDWYNAMSEKEKEYYGDCGYTNWLKSIKERIKGE